MPNSHDNDSENGFPSTEALSYSQEEVDLSRRPIDWDLDPRIFEAMSPEEKTAHMLIFHEQARRLAHATMDVAKRLARVVPPEDGVGLDETVDRELNPDKYPVTLESPQVEPPA